MNLTRANHGWSDRRGCSQAGPKLAHDVREEIDVSLCGPPVDDRRTERDNPAIARGPGVHATIREEFGAQAQVEGIELICLRVPRAVAEADDVERHVGETLEIGRFVDALCEVLREIEMALDHLAITAPAVCTQRRPDRDAARAA